VIIPMKKVSVIVQAKDAPDSVEKLRSLGILHVEYNRPPAGEEIGRLKEDINLVSSAVNIVSRPEYLKSGSKAASGKIDWKFIAKHIIDLNKRFEQLDAYSRVLMAEIAQWQPWGEFDPVKIEALKGKGIYIRFYEIPVKEIESVKSPVIIKEMFRRGSIAHCISIAQDKINLPFKEIALPKMGLEDIRKRLYEDQRMKELIIDDICMHTANLENLSAVRRSLEKQLEFQEALIGMGSLTGISYISGYIPAGLIPKLEKAALKEKWGLLVRDPSEEDAPPVLLHNPRWVRIIEPVLKLLGISPGYRELDASPVIVIFFSIFFGILVGDAGYGLVYLLLTLWFHKKKRVTAQVAQVFRLFYVLNSSAIIWGILTGTFFGQAWLISLGFRPLVPALNDPSIVQRLCFFIGALHLSIAHGWRALIKLPSSAFLADVGWIMVLWISYFLAGSLILGEPFPRYGLAAAICGIILVLFFSEPRRNPIKSLGAGFVSVTFGLGFMSAFTDVVSYVRLFAVGLAGVAIADTTNAMAAGLGAGAVAFAGGILIRFIGHALNIVLGPIAILVHGVRLNVLEFGLNHTGITWSGAAYKPLQDA